MTDKFEMVAKTFQGLEDVLAEELRDLGAENVEPGRRMVSFEGDLEMLYKANLCCRTALRILKPIFKFTAVNTDELYDRAKEFDWGTLMSVGSTFSIDTVAFSDEFTHSRFVTYRVKDAIVDWFKDRYGDDKRPGVRLQDADVMINVHISGDQVTLSLDSSGESLHKRGYRVAQTEAPINEVLAAGIILKSGWRGDCPLVDPMCGSGTFLIEAALIAANINPGVYRRHFSFENWKDFDPELFDRLYNDDSEEREVTHKIIGADMSPRAIDIAAQNIRSAGVGRMIELHTRPLSEWQEAPEGGILVTNPPYGERISSDDMEGLYRLIGNKLKNIFKGYQAWIIAAKNDYVKEIGLSPSVKIPILNGAIECELREYIIFEGDYKHFRAEGGRLRDIEDRKDEEMDYVRERKERRIAGNRRRFDDEDERPFREKRRENRGTRAGEPRNEGEKRYSPNRDRKSFDRERKPFDRERKPFDRERKPFDRERKPFDRERKPFDRDRKPFDRDRKPFDRERKPFDRERKPFDRERKPFDRERKPFDRDREEPQSENPLAKRRNEELLNRITGEGPKLNQPSMRPRKPRN